MKRLVAGLVPVFAILALVVLVRSGSSGGDKEKRAVSKAAGGIAVAAARASASERPRASAAVSPRRAAEARPDVPRPPRTGGVARDYAARIAKDGLDADVA